VWGKLPDAASFLDHLCLKMGIPENAWRYRKLDVFVYEVEEFHEP
jgi:AMMECR1 domain-containing protein